MRTWYATMLASFLLATTLAGCSSSDGSFTIEPPAAAGGAYHFSADVDADNYTWDMGDQLTTLFGKDVDHAFDFKDGTVKVTLHAKTSAGTKDYQKEVVVGSGKNEKATFLMEASHVWTIPGEKVKFSAAASKDPENDPLRFSWSCLRDSDAVRQSAHVHPNQGGLDYAKAPAGAVTSGLALKPIGPATMPIAGDMCASLGAGTKRSTTATTIEGAFEKTGIYKIYLLAADPTHPSVSGEFKIFVTNPSERPAALQSFSFNGTLQAGRDGQLQGACDATMLGVCDLVTNTFALPLGGLAGNLTVAYTPGLGGGAPATNNVTFSLYKGTTLLFTTGGAQGAFPLEASKLGPGAYRIETRLLQGADVDWSAQVQVRLDLDPSKVY